MADKAVLTLPLNPGGKDVENNNYRTRNAYEGQREREDVYDEGETLNMQMTLVDVIHGTMDPTSGSSPATLFIADFRFISHDRSRRFQRATIELRFQATNDPQDLNPPKVLKIAPMGSWGLQKSEKTEESKLGAKVDAGATFVANVSAGLEWSMTTTQTQCNEAKLEGGPTKRGRKIEPKNAAVWSMSENQDTEKGIPSLLRTVVLLERKNYVDFYCSILVKTKVHWWPEGLSPSVESRETGGNTNHVLFSPTMKRTKLPLAGIEPSELDKVVLNEWMAVTTRESIAPPLPATVLRDGQISNLTHTTQKSEELIPMAGESILKLNGTHSSEPKMEGQYPFKTSAQADKPLHITDAALKKAILDPLRGIGMHPSQKVDDPVPKLTDVNGSLPRGSKLEEGFSVEETLRLLLHAVRKGVEVIAEANRIRLEAWPEEQKRQ